MHVPIDELAMDSSPKRIIGIDAARGIALFSMFAVHSLWIFDDSGNPTNTTVTAAGRSAALFAVLAGVSLALMSGGPKRVSGRRLDVVSVGLLTRSIFIAVVGFLLGWLVNSTNVNLAVILVYYGAAFLLAIPLLRLSQRALVTFAAVNAIVAPVAVYLLRVVVADSPDHQLTLGSLLHPWTLLSTVFVSGSYPVLALMSFLAVGIAIGRLDLGSKLVAARLTASGLVMATIGWFSSTVLLFGLDGLDEIQRQTSFTVANGPTTRSLVLWWPQDDSSTWWQLAQRAPHSYTTFDLMNGVGSAMTIIGVLLLVTRSSAVRTALRPISDAGSMPMSIYALHIGMLALWVFDVWPPAYLVGMIIVALVFAVGWKAVVSRQGPLELLMARLAATARRQAAHHWSVETGK